MTSTQSSSKKLVAISLGLAILIAIPAIYLATRRKPADRLTQLAFAVMTSDLRGLAMAQAGIKLRTGRYTTDLERAGHLSSINVTPPVITLADSGWAATVRFKTIPGIQCGIGVFTRNPLKRLARSGEVVCK